MKAISTVLGLFAILLITLVAGAPNESVSAESTLPEKSIRKPSGSVGASLNINLDVLGIGKSIGQAIGKRQNRAAFVKSIRNKAFYAANSRKTLRKSRRMGYKARRYNVMVFNLAQDHKQSFRGVRFYSNARYGNLIYGIWVFESGTFVNKGDGGYLNWAFRGQFKRNGGRVRFRKA